MGLNIAEFLDNVAKQELLRLTTAGSVDDGKSTLIGRLLYDSKGVYEDQLAALKNISGTVDEEEIDFALLTDGLKAEREQGITIDVAYRFFSTPKRKFIIADTPGHEQYTRNMATGASTANLAIILIDARHGVLPQSKRHSFIASLLGIPHFLVAINKMDLMEYSQDVFEEIRKVYVEFSTRLNVKDVHFIPISALHGDNVVERSTNMPWYKGAPLLEYLENVYISSDRNLVDLRYPVQYVLRPDLNFRGYSGKVASGIIRKGDEVMVIPSQKRSKVKSIVTFDGEIDYAFSSQSVTVTLEDEVDISRGDMLVHVHNLPQINRHFEAMVVWMNEAPLDPAKTYIIKHTSNSVKVRIDSVRYKVDVNTLHRQKTDCLHLNEIGRIVFTGNRPIYFDSYANNRFTGSFVLIDVISNNTVAAGMIIDREPATTRPGKIHDSEQKLSKRKVSTSLISDDERQKRLKQKPVTIWLTGLVSSGKRKLAYALEKKLFDAGATCMVLDGSTVRSRLNRTLDFTNSDTTEHLRRVAEIARIMNHNGIISICAFVSPIDEVRKSLAEIIGSDRMIEVFVDAPLEWCKKNDQTGLYQKAGDGEINNLAGVSFEFESPKNPTLVIQPDQTSTEENVDTIIEYLSKSGIFPLK